MNEMSPGGPYGPPEQSCAEEHDDYELTTLGYEQKLHRTMGPFTSFALAFSMVSINTGIIALFSDPFMRVGGAGILLWLLVVPPVGTIVLVYAHMAGRMPITGYAYQWTTRLAGSHFGWFTGWIALISFIAGTSAISTAIGTVFAPEIWEHPTRFQIQGLSVGATLVVCLLNIYGIRLATRMNDIGAVIELVGTAMLVLALLAGLLFVFHDTQKVDMFLSLQPVGGASLTLGSVALGMLLPVSVLLGWDGAADLAEETLDPRRTAPRSMIRAFLISGILGFVLLVLLALCIPGDLSVFFSVPENPVLHIVRSRLGIVAAAGMVAVAFISILACLIANMAVATRMVFALSRDNMLPASRFLGRVHATRGTPDAAIVFVTAIAVLLDCASGGFVAAIYSMVGLAYYLTYFLTLIAVIIACYKGRVPAVIPGVFDLGSWLLPVTAIGVVWTVLVIVTLVFSRENMAGTIMAGVMFFIGLAWWFLMLRQRLVSGSAGVPALHDK
ncbi:Amino acid permease-associated region [Komagataeibacter xylinus E25]|nr:Amino acid permease-associated region [Komagataeibacter xylinus E25]RFP00213.1 amino acid permease [Komagataeibacter xylinus]